MGLRTFFLVPALVGTLLLSLGCGFIPGLGGDAAAEEIGLIDFGNDDLPTPVPEEVVARALSIDPFVLVEIRFLYQFQVRLERLRRVIRDLNAAADHSDAAGIDLDWVIEVHDVTRESDAFFEHLTSVRVPESLREEYEYLHVGMLEVIQVAGYGSDRLLAASVVVGPSGRSLSSMEADETDSFETLMREARFFLMGSESRIDHQVDEVGRAVNGLELR